MEYQKEHNKTFSYMVYALSSLVFIASLLAGNSTILIFSSALLAASVLILHSGHLINSILIKKSGVVVISGNYCLSNNLRSICRQQGSLFKSLSIALLIPQPGQQIRRDSIKELVESLSEQFEFSIEIAEANTGKITESLMTRLRMKEIAFSRISNASSPKAALLKRQIELMGNDIRAIEAMGKSFKSVMRIKAISFSADKAEAESTSSKNIEMLASKFSASTGMDCHVLVGERLLEEGGV